MKVFAVHYWAYDSKGWLKKTKYCQEGRQLERKLIVLNKNTSLYMLDKVEEVQA